MNSSSANMMVLGFAYGLQNDPDTPSSCLYATIKTLDKAEQAGEEVSALFTDMKFFNAFVYFPNQLLGHFVTNYK